MLLYHVCKYLDAHKLPNYSYNNQFCVYSGIIHNIGTATDKSGVSTTFPDTSLHIIRGNLISYTIIKRCEQHNEFHIK